MNNDLISRSSLIKWIDDSVSQYGGRYSADMMNMWALFRNFISDAPTVEYPFYQEAYQTGYEEGKKITSLKRASGYALQKTPQILKCGVVQNVEEQSKRLQI